MAASKGRQPDEGALATLTAGVAGTPQWYSRDCQSSHLFLVRSALADGGRNVGVGISSDNIAVSKRLRSIRPIELTI